MLLALILGLTVSSAFADDGCSCLEDILPVSCACLQVRGRTEVSCTKKLQYGEVIGSGRNCTVKSLRFHNSVIVTLAPAFFGGARMKTLIFDRVTIQLLGKPKESVSSFSGLEDSLQHFEVTGSDTVFTWNWRLLEKLTALKTFIVRHSMTGFVSNSISPTSLRMVELSKCAIWWIHDKAFKDLRLLTMIFLADNYIREVKRSMFPRPAEYLYSLDLSYNKLDALPNNLFKDMPRLREVRLDHNFLTVLKPDPFKPVFSQLKELWLDGNPFRCNATLCWILETETRPMFMDGTRCNGYIVHDTTFADLSHEYLTCARAT